LHSCSIHEDFVGIELDETAEVIRSGAGVWTVQRSDSGSSFATTVTRLSSASSLPNSPGVVRIATAGTTSDSAILLFGFEPTGDFSFHEPFKAAHFAAPGAFVEFRFRLASNADVTFNAGMYYDSLETPLAQRVIYVDGGEYRSVSDNGTDPADDHSSGVAVPSFDWVRVRFRTVNALLDTTEVYDASGALLATVTHPDGILDPTTPLHLGARFTQTTATSKLVDFDLIQVFAPIAR
jgi:hypothetical protein